MFELFEQEVGDAPDREHVLSAISCTDDERTDAAARDTLCRLLLERLTGEPGHHLQVLRQASMLRRVGGVASAVALLDDHVASLPPRGELDLANARFLRGTCLVAAGHPERALDDMRYAAGRLASDGDRAAALQIVHKLEAFLAATSSTA